MKKEILTDYKNIMFVGNKNSILVANYSFEYIRENNAPNSIRRFNKKLPALANGFIEKKTVELNTLYILNKYLIKIDQLIKQENNNNDFVCNIIVEHKLWDIITKGTYKYWLADNKISEIESNLWKEFMNNYLKVFKNIKFFSINLYKGDKTPKYRINEINYGRMVMSILEDLNKQSEEKILKKLLG